MTADADVVVAGAGHNSLITAAYLCRAGHRRLVLDARPVAGGGVASEELLLPGFLFDSCSTGHSLIQTNPLLADDELDLLGVHGLTYIAPRGARALLRRGCPCLSPAAGGIRRGQGRLRPPAFHTGGMGAEL